jgi:uncharacterized protein YndB with AHSA1/START domain
VIRDSIERDILIEAPVEVVWRVVNDPDHISQWFTDAAEIDLRPGGEGVLAWTGRATTEPMTVRIQVEKVEPPHLFSFRWSHPDGERAHEGNSLLVEFALAAEGENTRLRMVERGLLATGWSEERKAKYAGEHENGWTMHLAELRDYAARQARATTTR